MDEELSRWAADFRGGPPEGPLDAQEILRRVRRDDRLEWGRWAASFAAVSFGVAVFVALVVKVRTVTFAAFAAIVIPALVALLGYFVHARRRLARGPGSSMREGVERVVARRRADIGMLRASRAAQALLVLAFAAWFPFVVLGSAERFAREPWRPVVGGGASFLMFGLTFLLLERSLSRKRAELARWEETLGALEDGDRDGSP